MVSVAAWVALIVACVALALVRRQGRKLAHLTDMYWQLKYDQGEIRASVAPPPDEPPPATTAFVPIGAVKRSRS